MNEPPRGSRWKLPVSLGTLGLLGLAAAGIHFWLNALLEEHRRECVAIKKTFPVDVSPRPAILGPEEPGNVWELLVPAYAGMQTLDESCNYAHFDPTDTTMDVPRWIARAGPSLELCRRAARRRDRTWRGPLDPNTRFAGLTVRALSTKGLLLWRDGQDAEAAEWMLVALTIATDDAALHGYWGDQKVEEGWVVQDLRDLLSRQSLTVAQLEDLGRRLDLLRSLRVPFPLELRLMGAMARRSILESECYEAAECDLSGSPARRWSDMVGWQDFWSVRYAKVRILNDIRRCGRELEGISWRDPRAAMTEAERILGSYQGRLVQRKLLYKGSCCAEEESLIDLAVLSASVECARFQALHGRLPRTWEEAGLPASATLGIHLGESGLLPPGSSSGNCSRPNVEWLIGRRSSRK